MEVQTQHEEREERWLEEREEEKKGKRKWWLGGEEIGETTSYKYLGIDLRTDLNFKGMRERMIGKARKAMMAAWAMGMREGRLPVDDCDRVWKTLVRPMLEYGAEVWGDVRWEEAERLQREMGKMILRSPVYIANEVVLGELGWWRLRARRDQLRLMYWAKVTQMEEKRLVAAVYKASREGETEWCQGTKRLLGEIGMEEEWDKRNEEKKEEKQEEEDKEEEEEEKEEGGGGGEEEEEWSNNKTLKQWAIDVKKNIHAREVREWKERMEGKPKLRTYRKVKTRLSFEQYLNSRDRKGRAVLRGTNELRIETGRYPLTNRDREEEERTCLVCWEGKVEDESHFMLECGRYDEMREKTWESLVEEWAKTKMTLRR